MATHRRFPVNNSILLVLGAAGGLLWANVACSSYHWFTHGLHFVVNDVGMVFFSAIAANEVFEATLPGGSAVVRASRRRPAVCGHRRDVVPTLLYLVVGRPRPVGWSSG